MRKYQPAWEQLKEHKTVQLRADIATHKRIVRAIRKEKYKDIVYKVSCSMDGRLYQVVHKAEGEVLTFTLIPDTAVKNL